MHLNNLGGDMSLELGLNDILITRQWDNTYQYEVCTHVGATGYLMYNFSTQFKQQLERYLKYSESLPYSVSIVRHGTTRYDEVMIDIQKQLQARSHKEKANEL